MAGPVASAAAPATQTSNLIILSIAKLPKLAHGPRASSIKQSLLCELGRVQIADPAKHLSRWFYRSSADHTRSGCAFAGFLLRASLGGWAVPSWCRRAQPTHAPSISRARQTRASKALSGGTQQFRRIALRNRLAERFAIGRAFLKTRASEHRIAAKNIRTRDDEHRCQR